MTENDADIEQCRLAAEVLARRDQDVLHVVRSNDGPEAAAMVFEESNDRRAVAITEKHGGASYRIYGPSPFEGLAEAPDRLVDEPFRGRIRRSGGATDVKDAIWQLAESDVEFTADDINIVELDADLHAEAEDYRDSVVEGAATPAAVSRLDMYTPAAPAQWYGLTEDGRPVYLRYRGGHLQARVGGRRGVDGETVHTEQLGDGFDPAIEAERIAEAVPHDTLTFDVDLGAVEDIDDVEFDPGRLEELIGEDDGYSPEAEFARRCRRIAGTARTFANTYDGLLAVDAYREAHPAEEAALDREEYAGRETMLRLVAESLSDAATAVDENGDYATAAEVLAEVDGVIDQARGEFQRGHGLPIDPSSTAEARVNEVALGQYRRVFDAVAELHDRATYERED